MTTQELQKYAPNSLTVAHIDSIVELHLKENTSVSTKKFNDKSISGVSGRGTSPAIYNPNIGKHDMKKTYSLERSLERYNNSQPELIISGTLFKVEPNIIRLLDYTRNNKKPTLFKVYKNTINMYSVLEN